MTLTTEQIIMAWKSPEYRSQLMPEKLAELPEHPGQWIEDQNVQPILAEHTGDYDINCVPPGTYTGCHTDDYAGCQYWTNYCTHLDCFTVWTYQWQSGCY